MTPNSATEELPGEKSPSIEEKKDHVGDLPKDLADNRKATDVRKDSAPECPTSPTPAQIQRYQQSYIPHLTPQGGPSYYHLYGGAQMTPEPPSPATPAYDITSFLQAGFHHPNPFGSQYGSLPQPPLSPSARGVPPASPLFPRPTAALDPAHLDVRGMAGPVAAPASPSVPPYMTSPAIASSTFGGMYQGYPYSLNGQTESSSPEEPSSWDRNHHQPPTASYPPPASPSLGAQGLQMYSAPRATTGAARSTSFDEMLPPSALDPHIVAAAGTAGGASGASTGGEAHPSYNHHWGVDPYPQSPARPHHHYGIHHHHHPHPPMPIAPGGFGQTLSPYYPATSPGPPIQTTSSNKGPDGANLFIFHIPNHFTNVDMYRLFAQYGNLLSVRIMVERETGRSRGFGFVSYDSPESAALAIKELNGFAIGNKRLKVQHKQIRPNEQRNFNNNNNNAPNNNTATGTATTNAGDNFLRPDITNSSPSTGASPAAGIGTSPWYERQTSSSDTPGPLGSLEPLRSALPEVTGRAGTVE